MKLTLIMLMLVTIFSKILGFLREIILSYFYGASNISDAYLISTTIPATIFAFIGVGISTSFIPMYNKIEVNSGIKKANIFTSYISNILLLFCLLVIIFTFRYTELIVKIFASGFDNETLKITSVLTKISIMGIFFTTLVYIFNAFLQIKGKFLGAALTGIPLNIMIIGSIIISYSHGIYYLAIGSVFAAFSQFAILIPFIKKVNYKHIFSIKIDENIKNFIFLAFPVIMGVSVNQINILVDRTLASRIIEGGVSALVYSDRLVVFIQGIFVTTLLTIVYPKISLLAAKKDLINFKNSISHTFKLTTIILVPFTILILLFSKEIISILFGRGEFDSQAIQLTSTALFFYSFGIIGVGIREIFSKGFYAYQDTKTPIINATIAVVLNIVLNIVLSRYFGISGLALASSISATISAYLMYYSFKRKFGSFDNESIRIFLLKIGMSSFCMGVVSYFAFEYFKEQLGTVYIIVLTTILGFIVYIVLLILMKVKEINLILNQLYKRRK